MHAHIHTRINSLRKGEVPPGYRKTKVGIIPVDWKLIKLGQIFDFKNGLNKGKEFFGKGTPIVNYMDVFKNNCITAQDLKGRVSVSNDELRNYEVCKDDVFFTRTSETINEIGLTAVIIEELKNTVFSGFVLRARPKKAFTGYVLQKILFFFV